MEEQGQRILALGKEIANFMTENTKLEGQVKKYQRLLGSIKKGHRAYMQVESPGMHAK